MSVTIDKLPGLKVEIPYKFKPQSLKFGKAIMVSYIDARDAQDLLDSVVGPENWQTDYKVINDNLYASIGIKVKREDGTSEWVWKTDCGTESNQEKEKGEASDAFKRAGVQWGIGRFLYRLGIIELNVAKHTNGKEYPATDDGKILWNNDQITDYIRTHKLGKSGKTISSKRYQKPNSEPKYKTATYSQETIKKVEALEKNGLKGKECLKHYLPEFAKKNNLDIKLISELNDDKKLGELINYIISLEPAGI